jgi:SAM-dependent methyltransferase
MLRTPRSRFYDGRFYARVVDPFVSGLHRIIAEHVEPGSRVLEVGCGTGSLALRLAPNASEVVGVELSPAMAEYAIRRLDASTSNVSVVVGDVTEVLTDRPDRSFDVATMALVLHEMPAEAREPVLREVTRVATKLLCLEYRVPMPWNLPGVRNRIVEMLTGPEHFGAFRDFNRRGGTEGAATAAGLAYRNIRYPDKKTFDLSEIALP